ncbi:palmitoyl-(protein) hydrolase [Aureococcus anophagefferens]|nr:palmitoyl-(protein) hydrolase [Aureococcus anophagefferens]
MASNGYQELVNAIIRPPRAEYDMDDLGPASFEWHGHAFQRVDLELLAEELVQKARDHGLSVPGFVVSIALRMRDDFIDPAHSRALHGKYAGDKNLVLVEGDHNSPRPRFLYDSAAIFLSNYMGVPPAAAIPGATRSTAATRPGSRATTTASTSRTSASATSTSTSRTSA